MTPRRRRATAADVFWLTVPDDAHRRRRARARRHCCPSRSSDPARRCTAAASGRSTCSAPLRERGVTTLSLHPLQTFPGGEPDPQAFVGVPFAVTAADDDGRVFGTAAVYDLGGVPFDLADDAKPLYHLAATVASNLLVALESEAAGLMAAATGRGHDEAASLLAPLVATTAANVGAHGAAAGALGTGRTRRRRHRARPPGAARASRAALRRHLPRALARGAHAGRADDSTTRPCARCGRLLAGPTQEDAA